jgi:uncharacterized protein YndB with AHSA1/START domain
MNDDVPQLVVTRVASAPRSLVYQAFTDPDQFVAWWGPVGNDVPREQIDFDVRTGGHLRWTEFLPADPSVHVRGDIELIAVVEGELLEGVLHVAGQLPGGFLPFETRMRIEFLDDGAGRTRLEIRQWLPPDMASPTEQGWGEALGKLDALLLA